jgi:hypothetical protein
MGDFFLNKCKEEYLDCKFPAFNPGKMIERQAKGAFMNNIFFGDFLKTEAGGADEWLQHYSQSTSERPGPYIDFRGQVLKQLPHNRRYRLYSRRKQGI